MFVSIKQIMIIKKFNFNQFQSEFYRKVGKKYSRIMIFPPIDWCDFNAGKLSISNFQKVLLNIFLKSASMMFHPCPFEGRHTFFNVTPDVKIFEVFQLGTYKFTIKMTDSNNRTLFALSTHLTLTN